MRPCVFVKPLFGQTLQQQSGSGMIVGSQRDVGFELFGVEHIVGQHLGDTAAFQRNYALPRLAVFGLDGDGENAVFAQQAAQAFVVADAGGFVPPRGGAAGVFGSGLDHQHFQTAFALHLHG